MSREKRVPDETKSPAGTVSTIRPSQSGNQLTDQEIIREPAQGHSCLGVEYENEENLLKTKLGGFLFDGDGIFTVKTGKAEVLIGDGSGFFQIVDG